MNKNFALRAAVLLTAVLFLLTACGSSDTDSADTDTSTQTAWDGTLPDYSYNGSDPYIKAICDYTVSKWSGLYPSGDVAIPAPVILYTDDSDPSDIMIWGDFRIDHYNLSDDSLIYVSGGEIPGRFHLRANEDGSCDVTGFDMVDEGSGYKKDIQALCKGVNSKTEPSLYNLFMNCDTASDDTISITDHVRLVFIGRYIEDNGLPITTCQNYGSDPVTIDPVLQVTLNGTPYIDTGEYSFLNDEEQRKLEESAEETREEAEENGAELEPELHIYLTYDGMTRIFERADEN